MHDHDQDYEVAEPAVTQEENGDADRSPSAARFWRKASTAGDPVDEDSTAAQESTNGQDSPEGDTSAYGRTSAADLADPAGPADAVDSAHEADPGDDLDPAGEEPFDDDVIVVAEVIDAEPGSAADEAEHRSEPIAMPMAAETTDGLAAAHGPDPARESETEATAYDREVSPEPVPAVSDSGDDVSEQPFDIQAWREIQASFVDDPRGAVQMAADAADSALSTLVTALRDQQASLDPAATQDTEQLRAALQEYRRFCQAISELGRRLPQPAASR